MRLLHAGLLLGLLPGMAHGCAALSVEGWPSERFVEAERALIVWDQTHHVEHFIRQASFRTSSIELGFLVPTPETPELAEVDPAIFDLASKVGQPVLVPPEVSHTPWHYLVPILAGALDTGSARRIRPRQQDASSAPGKKWATTGIMEGQDVAGYHATVLSASDLPAITAWLKLHGFASSPELQAWLKTYADKKWKITAFELIKSNGDDMNTLTTRAVRLSFPTDVPFYPYSEPGDRQRASAASPMGRALRVAILSDHRMEGRMADGTRWPGQLKYAGSSKLLDLQPLGPMSDWLKLARLDDAKHTFPVPTELTAFLDESNPRPGTADLHFTPDPNPAPFRGQEVDPKEPVQFRLDFSNLLADVATILALVLIPAAPLYCGWKVLKRRRAAGARNGEPGMPPPGHPILRRVLGASAIGIGLFYGAQTAFMLVSTGMMMIVGIFAGTPEIPWMVVPFVLLLGGFAVMVWWSYVYCGAHLLKTKPFTEKTRRRWPLLCASGRWEGYMGVFCLVAGAVMLVSAVIFAATLPFT